ncbi:hypothetical protein BFP97_06060 [Roseivirga sp. 4D4]|uniref:alpha/beta fold hydrolase n=1 Tax=Roseivirga sp. 4D4 TaxID=1889784 RepID=UPI000852FA98|nr:alpha/beta fold hydrolase [Roseivirga sp. 4D4]OEK01097.1 hypothetical protein BFP97_06060 [Roseivirga sp. 4D4]
MKTWKARYSCLVLLAVALTLTTSSCDNNESVDDTPAEVVITERWFDLGDFRLNGRVGGEKGFTIIYESGLGHDATSWTNVMRAVGKEHKVVSYSRGGYGLSELGPEPRDLLRLSDELRDLKQIVSPNEKVILVGHSWGGAIIRAYAIRFPEDVHGLVFVDPSHENQLILTQPEEDDIAQGYARLIGAMKEAEQLIEGVEYMTTLPNLPDIPVNVLTNTDFANPSEWIEHHQSLGTGLSQNNFKQTLVTSGHNIHWNQPQVVIWAITDLIARIK